VQTTHLQNKTIKKINYNNNKFCTNVLIFVCADVFLDFSVTITVASSENKNMATLFYLPLKLNHSWRFIT